MLRLGLGSRTRQRLAVLAGDDQAGAETLGYLFHRDSKRNRSNWDKDIDEFNCDESLHLGLI